MDKIDRNICRIVQSDGRISSSEIAETVSVSVSTANERVRRLVANGVISSWRGVLDPVRAGAALCSFVLIDMVYEGEEEATEILRSRPEVQELHHISGPHSYLMKIRVANTEAMQEFLQQVVKPLRAVQRTETIFTLGTLKETTELLIGTPGSEA